jgi:hypothetical protein
MWKIAKNVSKASMVLADFRKRVVPYWFQTMRYNNPIGRILIMRTLTFALLSSVCGFIYAPATAQAQDAFANT